MAAKALNNEAFEKEVLQSEGTALVDFWAGWCGPCRMLAPVIEELADDFEGKILVGKVDIVADEQLAVQYDVMTIPTVILFKNGEEVGRLIGIQPKKNFVELIEKA